MCARVCLNDDIEIICALSLRSFALTKRMTISSTYLFVSMLFRVCVYVNVLCRIDRVPFDDEDISGERENKSQNTMDATTKCCHTIPILLMNIDI